MTARTLVLLLVMVCGFVTPLVGGTPGLAEFRVSVEDDPAFFGSLDTDADADGSFTVVWDTWEPGSFMRLFASTGQPTSDVAVAPFEPAPVIASDRRGGFMVAWPGTRGAVGAQRFDHHGRPLGDAIELVGEGARTVPALAMADAGHFMGMWESRRRIAARPFDRLGDPVADPFPAPQFSLGLFVEPAIAVDPAGAAVMVWTQDDPVQGFEQDGSGGGVFARRVTSAGEPVGGEFPVNLATEGFQGGPSVALGRDGRFMVAWHSQQADGSWDVVTRSFAPSACVSHPGSMCLHDGRFQVEVDWHDHRGNEGPGRVPEVPGHGPVELRSRDSAVLEFFGSDIWEVLVKVLDGRSINDHFWVYQGAATDVAYTLNVYDTSCHHTRTYDNLLGVPATAVTDDEAFPGCQNPVTPSCVGDDDTFCLGDGGRFRVEVSWLDYHGNNGQARIVTLPAGRASSSDSGLFQFFDPDNWEMLVKVLDGCYDNDHFWVFAATASDLPFTLRITDTASNTLRTYSREPGAAPSSLIDTEAFPTCDEK